MSTGTTNKIPLTPVCVLTRARIYGTAVQVVFEIGHTRSRPAEIDSTLRPNFVKPVGSTEKPTAVTTTALPLEPAQEPVPGAIPA
jgi:hypothetical protein